MRADAPGEQELDPRILADAREGHAARPLSGGELDAGGKVDETVR
jgi:hypothetical protein